MLPRPPRSTPIKSSAASDVYKRQWHLRVEQSIQKALFLPQEKKEYFVKMNVDGLLRGDYESRMKGYSIGIQNGFMCPNDIRRLESMD